MISFNLLAKTLSCLAIIWALSYQTSVAQINIFSGFTSSFLYSNPMDEAVESYNDNRPELANQLDKLNAMFGLQAGVRYRYESVAVMAGIRFRTKKLKANGALNGNADFEEKFNVGVKTLFAGTEIFLETTPFSIGGSLGYDFLNISHSKQGENEKQSILKSNVWSSNFFLSLNLDSGGYTRLSIRPFWDITWQNHDFAPIYSKLDFTPAHNNIKLNAFGISLILMNGN